MSAIASGKRVNRGRVLGEGEGCSEVMEVYSVARLARRSRIPQRSLVCQGWRLARFRRHRSALRDWSAAAGERLRVSLDAYFLHIEPVSCFQYVQTFMRKLTGTITEIPSLRQMHK